MQPWVCSMCVVVLVVMWCSLQLGETVLHGVAWHGLPASICKLLCEAGCKINAINKVGRTSKVWVSMYGWDFGQKKWGSFINHTFFYIFFIDKWLVSSIIDTEWLVIVLFNSSMRMIYFNGLVQDCSISTTNTLEILQTWMKPSV